MARETLVEETDDQARDGLRRPPPRFHRPLTVVLGVLFLFVPLIAYVFGDRARPIENRRLADAPSFGDGWDVFPNTSTWFTDHLPLRGEGVRTNTWLSRKVFGEEPSYGGDGTLSSSAALGAAGAGSNDARESEATTYPTVVVGTDGWLYLGSDFERACEPTLGVDATFARLRRFEQMITKSGRRVLITIAPDKSTIVPDHLPDHYLGEECATARKREFWASIANQPLPSYFDLRGPLERQQQADGVPIYRALDTHWTSHGSAIYARELARALDPSLWGDSRIEPAGPQKSGGDLPVLLGEERTEEVQKWNVVRPGVTGDWQHPPKLGATAVRLANATSGRPLISERALLLGDSFTQAARGPVASLFTNVVAIQHQMASSDVIATEIVDARLVVLEIVERNVDGGSSSILTTEKLNAIQAALDRAPRSTTIEPG